MATMHPADGNMIALESERKVYDTLKAQLKDKVHVFYSVQWQNIERDGTARLGEADFIIVDPDNGMLVLECKGGTRITYDYGVWTLYTGRTSRILKESPFAQARKSMFDLIDRYKQLYNRNFPGAFASAAIFPHYNLTMGFSPDQTANNTIQFSDMNDLQRKINYIFHSVSVSKQMSKDDFESVIQLIAGDSSSTPPIGAIFGRSTEMLAELDNGIEANLSMLHNYDEAIIVGPAGTGKTYMAVLKAEEYAHQGNKVLYVCFNRLNAQRVKKNFADYGIPVDCYTFHGLVQKIIGYSIMSSMDISLPGIDTILSGYDCPKYDAIIVDEAQDFAEGWAFALRTCFLKDEMHPRLYVFYDEDQNIYDRNFGEAFFIKYPPFVLRRNLRNTQNIWTWLCDKTQLGQVSVANQVSGIDPVTYSAKNSGLALNWVTKQVGELVSQGIKPSDIVILTDMRMNNTPLVLACGNIAGIPITDITVEELTDDSIAVSTAYAYKGLESPVVFYLSRADMPVDSKLEYVAFSRAKCLLYVVKYK